MMVQSDARKGLILQNHIDLVFEIIYITDALQSVVIL
jgi:hypothetical protein